MILADQKDALQYCGICPALDAALHRLSEGLSGIGPDSTWETESGDARLSCFSYETLPEEECRYEAHELWGDIHVMLEGQERVCISRPDTLQEVERLADSDCTLYCGEAEHTVILRPNAFLVVFPKDAHRIKMQVQGPESVRKAVFKFKL